MRRLRSTTAARKNSARWSESAISVAYPFRSAPGILSLPGWTSNRACPCSWDRQDPGPPSTSECLSIVSVIVVAKSRTTPSTGRETYRQLSIVVRTFSGHCVLHVVVQGKHGAVSGNWSRMGACQVRKYIHHEVRVWQARE